MFGKDDSKKAVATRLAFAVVFALALLGCAGCAQVTGGAYDSPSTPESAQTDAQKSTESAQDAESVSDDEGEEKSSAAELPKALSFHPVQTAAPQEYPAGHLVSFSAKPTSSAAP